MTSRRSRLYAHGITLNTTEISSGLRHDVAPLLARGRLVTVDGHPICASCGAPVVPVAVRSAPANGWEHVPDGQPYPRRSRWFAPVTWTELRGMRTFRDFTDRYPWTARPELCGGAVVTEDGWAEGTRRLRDYHGQLSAIRRWRRPAGENPYLELLHVLAGGRQLAWSALPAGLRTVLDLPARRRELATVFAWAIPDQPALAVLASLGPLLESGAGSGYWAALLAARGADIVASDIAPPAAEGQGHRPWAEVLPLDAVSAIRAHPGRVLFLCWPPYDDDGASYQALRAYQGQLLIYAGDVAGGATGTVRFHRELAANWSPVEQVALPNWPGLRDRLIVYERNAVRRSLAGRDRCPECGRYLRTGAVGRCDACFGRNPPAMALQVNGHRVEYPQQAVDAMPPALRRAFELSPSRVWPP